MLSSLAACLWLAAVAWKTYRIRMLLHMTEYTSFSSLMCPSRAYMPGISVVGIQDRRFPVTQCSFHATVQLPKLPQTIFIALFAALQSCDLPGTLREGEGQCCCPSVWQAGKGAAEEVHSRDGAS